MIMELEYSKCLAHGWLNAASVTYPGGSPAPAPASLVCPVEQQRLLVAEQGMTGLLGAWALLLPHPTPQGLQVSFVLHSQSRGRLRPSRHAPLRRAQTPLWSAGIGPNVLLLEDLSLREF